MIRLKEHSAKSLLDIINALPIAVSIIDRFVKVILANTKFVEFSGKDQAQLVGQAGGDALNCINHFQDPQGCGFGLDCIDCKLRRSVLHTLSSQRPLQLIETSMTLKDKGKRILRVSTHPLMLNKEAVVMLTIEDYTEIQYHEQTMLEKEKLTAVLETAGAVCHELSQPLQVISGFCHILADTENLDKKEIHRAVNAILSQTDRMARLNHDLMNITRYKTKEYLTSKIIDIAKSSRRP